MQKSTTAATSPSIATSTSTFAATAGPVTAVLDIPAGRVLVTAAEQSVVTVEVKPADASKARDVRAAAQTTAVFTDGVLRVETPVKNQYFGASGALEVSVQLPAGSGIVAKAGAAEFRTAGPLGDVTFDGAHGTVHIDEAATLRLNVHAGDVRVGRLVGDGVITVSAGDIHIDEAARGAVTLHTGYGAITVGAAHGASATLDAGTSYGRVSNALSNTEGAAAALNIHATTAYGDITARSL
ncbi:DUF4097 family beta strand repeat-containing protein [Streptomyces sp. NBC_00083]|uniref:DUF4097 family beta strand repeat-containing protein n=1 Tax=Streptomyces sp. NBC_00083 TaxID=2975647 RepID=UPI00225C42D0|nr:DUF4097 family beta strand repeat-containing protein [Streptomyces sp. NBC_00083]MCX5384516.1 DUF4097 domain-containing protein [Streptomyces sp. NBC_00083]